MKTACLPFITLHSALCTSLSPPDDLHVVVRGDDRRVGHPDEEAALDDAGQQLQLALGLFRVCDLAAAAVEYVVAVVGDVSLAALCATQARLDARGAVASQGKGTTSTGSGKRPSAETFLPASATTTKRRAAAATSFSRRSAPPPPLMSARPGPISSAPSMARSSCWTSAKVASGMPSRRACSSVRREVGTPRTLSPSRTRSPRRSTIQ